jgi:hypothetical protein
MANHALAKKLSGTAQGGNAVQTEEELHAFHAEHTTRNATEIKRSEEMPAIGCGDCYGAGEEGQARLVFREVYAILCQYVRSAVIHVFK